MAISIRLTPEEEARLDALTARDKRFYVSAALRAYVEDLEDAFAADNAIDAFGVEGKRSRPLSALKAESVQ